MKVNFTVTIDLPLSVDKVMMAQYIHDAVANWTGGMDPQHPLGCKDINPVVSCRVSGIPFKVEGKKT